MCRAIRQFAPRGEACGNPGVATVIWLDGVGWQKKAAEQSVKTRPPLLRRFGVITLLRQSGWRRQCQFRSTAEFGSGILIAGSCHMSQQVAGVN